MTSDPGLRHGLDRLFAAIDTKDIETFLSFLTDDATFRFGSAPAVSGKAVIRDAVDGFFSSIASSRHSIANVLRDGAMQVCEGEVTYRRMDGSEVSLPFANVFELAGPLIRHYRIYIDIGPLYTT
jgi:ketosteroid isomerase-like protein